VDEVAATISAPAEKVYDLITDVTQMGRWSPECTGGRWTGDSTGPAVGATFKGSNRRGLMRWTTHCEVTKADPGTAFEWQVKESGMKWGYRFEPEPGGTLVTEYREQTRDTPLYIKLVQRSGLLGRDRDKLLVDGMRQTLERVKEAAEDSH
jgi:uncharacterized protein YndB with AHSA1/START domain